MYRLWCFLAQFFDRLAKKSSRGKAKRDQYGWSARQRAFYHFDKGLRPSQLPDLGVAKKTIYRYYQSWKGRYKESSWRILRKVLMDPEHGQEASNLLGISHEQLVEALKRSRSAAQFRKRVGLDEAVLLQKLCEEARQQDLDRLIHRLGRCQDFEEWRVKLEQEAKRLGMSWGELIVALRDRARAANHRV